VLLTITPSVTAPPPNLPLENGEEQIELRTSFAANGAGM